MPTPLELNYWCLIKIQNPKESLEVEFNEQETKEAIRMLSLSIVREWQCKIQCTNYCRDWTYIWPASLWDGHAYDDPIKNWFSMYIKCWADLIAWMYADWMLFSIIKFCNRSEIHIRNLKFKEACHSYLIIFTLEEVIINVLYSIIYI